MTVLRIDSLTKVFGRCTAVDDVSFAIEAGSSFGIVGESGSGKTTIARTVVGLETPTSGSISCCGTDRSRPARSTRARRQRARETQIVFQDPYASLDPRQTVERALAEAVRCCPGGPTVAELADMVALDARMLGSLPRHLSGGQRQRVAIARALAARPRLLVLDESVAALDVSIQAQVLNLLADIRERTAVSYLVISHDLAVVRQVTEHGMVLQAGRVVERGTTDELLGAPGHPYTRALLASVPAAGLAARPPPIVGRIHVRLTPTEQDRLLLFTAAELARARRVRGVLLNVPEATALIADAVCEAARGGSRLAEAVAAGRAVLRPDELLPGVADIVTEVQVEAVFDDGSRLAVVTDPFRVEARSAVIPGPAPLAVHRRSRP